MVFRDLLAFTKISRSVKVELLFLDGRIEWYLKKGRYEKRTVLDALIHLAIVVKYIAIMVLELVKNAACNTRKVG